MTIRTIEPRSEYIKINTNPETKRRLQEIAQARGWSLSLLCHEILQTWLRLDDEKQEQDE